MTNLLGEERFELNGGEFARNGWLLELPAHGAQLLHFDAAAGIGAR